MRNENNSFFPDKRKIREKPDTEFDDITRLAALISGCPIAFISLFDNEGNQQFMARYGLDLIRKSVSTLVHTILSDTPKEVIMIEDVKKDPRFHTAIEVDEGMDLRFYAGKVITDENETLLGYLCVADDHEKTLNYEQVEAIASLARLAARVLHRNTY